MVLPPDDFPQLEQFATQEAHNAFNANVPFRIAAKNIFLTYPQSTALPHQVLHKHLEEIPNVHNVLSCREKHAPVTDDNGRVHIIKLTT